MSDDDDVVEIIIAVQILALVPDASVVAGLLVGIDGIVRSLDVEIVAFEAVPQIQSLEGLLAAENILVDGGIDHQAGGVITRTGHSRAGEGIDVRGLGFAGDGLGEVVRQADVPPRGRIGLADDQPDLELPGCLGEDSLILGTHSGAHRTSLSGQAGQTRRARSNAKL